MMKSTAASGGQLASALTPREMRQSSKNLSPGSFVTSHDRKTLKSLVLADQVQRYVGDTVTDTAECGRHKSQQTELVLNPYSSQ